MLRRRPVAHGTVARGTVARGTVALGTVTLLLATTLPAFAAASFTSGAQAQAGAQEHAVTLVVTEVAAEDENYGETTRVRLAAPAGFAPTCGTMPVDWECSAGEGALTWDRRVLARGVADVEFSFSTTVPAINGDYAFTVTQSDEPVVGEDGEPQRTTVTAGRPTMTVVGGQDPPPPEPTQEPDRDPEPGPTPSPSASSGGQEDNGSQAPSSQPDPGPADDEPSAGAGDADDGDGDQPSEDDEPAPRAPTRGRSRGTTLGVSPVAPSSSPRPQVDDPAVADDPVVGTPQDDPTAPVAGSGRDDQDGDDATVAATGSDPTQGSSGDGLPWQQLAGGGLLLAGGLVLLWRQFGEQVMQLGLPRLPRLPWRGN
jgi:hypothetical protein